MQRRYRILIPVIVLTLCFIWGNSLMPASVSEAFSTWVKNVLNSLLGSTGFIMSGDGVLRKIVHATEFAALGIVLSFLVNRDFKKYIFILALCGLGVAIIDETIQLFVDGRGPRVSDVLLDFSGFVLGGIVGWLLMSIHRRRRRVEKRLIDNDIR